MAERLVYEDTDKRIYADGDGEDRTERIEWVNPDAPGARLDDLQARVDAAAALAEDANATAQEVADAMKPRQ